MNCPSCGNVLSAQARFCGACGSSARGPGAAVAAEDDAQSASVRQLRRHLHELSSALRTSGTPQFLIDALEALARGPGSERHLTVVIGEKSRGKTTLVNRLLGAAVLPTGRLGYRSSLFLRGGEAWRIETGEGAEQAATLPLAPGLQLRGVQGPAPLLRLTTLLDTPSLNEIEVGFEERVVAELVPADAFLICVAANQLLTQQERDLIRHRLLPLLGGDGALVVTHTDKVETDEDWRALQTRARRFGGERLQTLFLPRDPEAAPAEVLGFIERSAERHQRRQATAWRQKSVALLRGIEQELAAEVASDAPPAAAPSPEERLLSLRRILQAEHALALAEAEAVMRQRLADLRLGLAERIARWTPDHAQHEGVAELAADIQTALRDATQLYVSTLGRSLSNGAPRSLQLAAEQIRAPSAALGEAESALSTPEPVSVTKERKLLIPTLAIAGVGLLFLPGAAPVAAVSALFMSHQLRRQRELAFAQQVRTNAHETLSTWIADSEPQLLGHMRQAVRPVLAGLLDRVERIVATSPAPARSARQETLSLARRCLALATEDAESPHAEVSP